MLCLTLTLAKTISDSQGPEVVRQLVDSLNWHPGANGGSGSEFAEVGTHQVQGSLGSAHETVGFILSAARSGTWGVHLTVLSEGLGDRDAQRTIFQQAVDSAEEALRAPGGVRVVQAQGRRLYDSKSVPAIGPIESTLQLLCSIERRRSDEGQEAGLMINAGNSQTQAAKTLGVSQQAVSARLQAGYWYESRKVAYWLAAQLEQLVNQGEHRSWSANQ